MRVGEVSPRRPRRTNALRVAEMAPTSIDPYGEATAEFYELLATAHWAELGPRLVDLLAGADPSAGPVLDVGAGTGIALPYLRAAVPDARILAVEPSTAMRTALHTRLCLDDDLRERVTVVPFRIEDAPLPRRVCAAVASAVVGHLDAVGRVRMWSTLADRLRPGAPVVVGVLPPTRPDLVPPTRYRALPVGEHVYEGWMEAEPVDDRRMRWTMSYRVLGRDGVVLAERQASSIWHCYDADDVAREVEGLGFAVEHPDDEHVVLRRRRVRAPRRPALAVVSG